MSTNLTRVTNNAWGQLSVAITTSSTTLTLGAGQGARFPSITGGSGDVFYATLANSSNVLEVVKVTATAGDTLTVVRAQDNTVATAYNIGDRIELRPTAALFNAMAQLGTSVNFSNVTVTSVSGTALTVNGAGASNIANFVTTGNGLAQVFLQNGSNGAAAEMDLYIASDTVTARIQVLSSTAGANARLFTATNHPLILGANNGSNITIGTNGGVSIAAAASGAPLTVNVNTSSGTGGILMTGNANDVGVVLTNTATGGRTYDLLSSGGTSGLPQGSFSIYDNAVGARLQILSTGATTIFGAAAATTLTLNAPTTGTTLSVNGVSGSQAASISGNDTAATYTLGVNILNTNATAATSTAGYSIQAQNATCNAAFRGGNSTVDLWVYTSHPLQFATSNVVRGSIAAGGGWTLASPTSGGHQFNGLTNYNDNTTSSEIGWRSLPINIQQSSYTFIAADRGRVVSTATSGITYTCPQNVFAQGSVQDVIIAQNNAASGTITIAAGTGVTMRLAGTTTTGNRTVAAKGYATIYWSTPTEVWVSGPGVS